MYVYVPAEKFSTERVNYIASPDPGDTTVARINIATQLLDFLKYKLLSKQFAITLIFQNDIHFHICINRNGPNDNGIQVNLMDCAPANRTSTI